MLEAAQINRSKKWVRKLGDHVKHTSNVFSIVSDPTRLKMILLLKRHHELCVTDFSEILGISISAVSHQLSLLERADIVEKTKMGKTVCHTLKSENIGIPLEVLSDDAL